MISEIPAADVPYLTTDQMIEVDRAMVEDYRIDLVRTWPTSRGNVSSVATREHVGSSCLPGPAETAAALSSRPADSTTTGPSSASL